METFWRLTGEVKFEVEKEVVMMEEVVLPDFFSASSAWRSSPSRGWGCHRCRGFPTSYPDEGYPTRQNILSASRPSRGQRWKGDSRSNTLSCCCCVRPFWRKTWPDRRQTVCCWWRWYHWASNPCRQRSGWFLIRRGRRCGWALTRCGFEAGKILDEVRWTSFSTSLPLLPTTMTPLTFAGEPERTRRRPWRSVWTDRSRCERRHPPPRWAARSSSWWKWRGDSETCFPATLRKWSGGR